MIWAIDPGPEQSALVVYNPLGRVVSQRLLAPNGRIKQEIVEASYSQPLEWDGTLAIEMIASWGMPVGAKVFDTCIWIGRFVEAWTGDYRLIKAPTVRTHICGTPRAKKGNVRRALLDMWPETGGGATPQIGTKKEPGPLYGFSDHLWSALAVAVTADEAPR